MNDKEGSERTRHKKEKRDEQMVASLVKCPFELVTQSRHSSFTQIGNCV